MHLVWPNLLFKVKGINTSAAVALNRKIILRPSNSNINVNFNVNINFDFNDDDCRSEKNKIGWEVTGEVGWRLATEIGLRSERSIALLA